MKLITLLATAIFLASCATSQNNTAETAANTGASTGTGLRAPSGTSSDLSGDYLAEGLFMKRTAGLTRPAIRMYMDRSTTEADTYYGVLVEYPNLLSMVPPYVATQKIPAINKLIGYLNRISTRVSAYKFVSQGGGTYKLHSLIANNGQIAASPNATMTLILDPNNREQNPLANAKIIGNEDGDIVFPPETAKPGNIVAALRDLTVTQYELAAFSYKIGKLKSTWRGNWKDLEGSYLSEYGLMKDGVLELYSEGNQKKMKFIKTNRTHAKNFTNPKSATLEGDYNVYEPVPKMYVLVPTKSSRTASDIEMNPRIGLFLDVFDASAPEAGSHMVTELGFTSPNDPEDFMMYYEHPQHVKNVGVEPPLPRK